MSSRERIEGFHIGLRLVRRDIKKWTQKEAAFAATQIAKTRTGNPDAKVSASQIAMIETAERNPSLEVASWIAEAVGYEVTDLCILKPERAAS